MQIMWCWFIFLRNVSECISGCTVRLERWPLKISETEEMSQTTKQYFIFLVKRLVTRYTVATLKQHFTWTAQISKMPEVWWTWAILQVWLFGQNYSINNFSSVSDTNRLFIFGMYSFFFFFFFFNLIFVFSDIVVMISIGKYISLFLEYLWSVYFQ